MLSPWSSKRAEDSRLSQPAARSEDVHIRETARADLPSILTITNREITGGNAHFGTTPLTLPELASDWEQTRKRYAWCSAERGGRVVGYARAGPWKSRGAYAWTCEIGVYVEPTSQRCGIGRRLYQALFADLRRKGMRTLVAGITLPNEPSIRLHEAMGMTFIGRFCAIGYKNRAWRDVGYWELHWDDERPPE
ncbi:MAG: N-acetyltransferase family protein [Planctomycetota bacterium]|nr:MAG: N-acetyltransferase family protein [Planctomycetota bacterium]